MAKLFSTMEPLTSPRLEFTLIEFNEKWELYELCCTKHLSSVADENWIRRRTDLMKTESDCFDRILILAHWSHVFCHSGCFLSKCISWWKKLFYLQSSTNTLINICYIDWFKNNTYFGTIKLFISMRRERQTVYTCTIFFCKIHHSYCSFCSPC